MQQQQAPNPPGYGPPVTAPAPRRPLSPAPSYHTLPPDTEATLSSTSTSRSSNNNNNNNALLNAARTAPDAILSHLILSNHPAPPSKHLNLGANGANGGSGTARHLSASSADGKGRYRVSFPSSMEARVGKVVGGGPGGLAVQEDIASVQYSSRGFKVVELTVEAGVKRREVVVLEVGYEELQAQRGMRVGMRVGGVERGLRWVVVGVGEEEAGLAPSGGDGRRKSGERGGSGRLPAGAHEKRRQQAAFSALRLVDAEGNVYAEYSHEVGLPSVMSEERWGRVSIRSRVVMLDEGVDRAFVTLAALLECYVRIFGQVRKEERHWGNFAGGVACSVM
ncbi:uncharacterized protein HMPREF1541_05662 [Cyphellophora europaea CBS 101466]|uniref:Uncharacterized protein n=1 Tax=Cyphellophora europaea (strain CBS 101466) TaxID=1220924 RepID=W2RUS0_CYPE1|nr:uncharacterized protein HMPREF1541_05662 [Cyphellophora europaea CBS 101466]ETN39439.1 hypothetical protein HMPREF1541_05662 [Cyphellophora europaea CBS 101466]